ncbi:MAG: peptidoglycan DD-metalloendopeptidase family protein [Cyanobacteria bacterium]|nr:peptidoglycan DD-metalloendopeptidase family protein [Cyanobacteriota bacterium]MDW8199756.1 peptidoglycan DD-metalloendopeptidase family protein [Cyanobacteriota bacterium SKYGB_h_bin112]
MSRTYPQRVKSSASPVAGDSEMGGQVRQVPTEVNRRACTSAAVLGLAISMGASSLLIPQLGEGSIASVPIVSELALADSSTSSASTVNEPLNGQFPTPDSKSIDLGSVNSHSSASSSNEPLYESWQVPTLAEAAQERSQESFQAAQLETSAQSKQASKLPSSSGVAEQSQALPSLHAGQGITSSSKSQSHATPSGLVSYRGIGAQQLTAGSPGYDASGQGLPRLMQLSGSGDVQTSQPVVDQFSGVKVAQASPVKPQLVNAVDKSQLVTRADESGHVGTQVDQQFVVAAPTEPVLVAALPTEAKLSIPLAAPQVSAQEQSDHTAPSSNGDLPSGVMQLQQQASVSPAVPEVQPSAQAVSVGSEASAAHAAQGPGHQSASAGTVALDSQSTAQPASQVESSPLPVASQAPADNSLFDSASNIAATDSDVRNRTETLQRELRGQPVLPSIVPVRREARAESSQLPVNESSLYASASVGSENYAPINRPLVGQTVSPELPPLGSADKYLPGQEFNGYIWPARGVLTSGYGWRWGRMHRGIDIAGPIGTPIIAAAPGVVVTAGWNSGGYGNLVEIQHPDGSLTLYAHNSRILVQVGQQVSQGQQIAEMGSTGYSTGPHLHFEIHPRGQGAVNPIAMLPSR